MLTGFLNMMININGRQKICKRVTMATQGSHHGALPNFSFFFTVVAVLFVFILNRKKKTDTFFSLVLNRKVQIIVLKINTYFNSKTLKSTFKEKIFIKYRTLRYDVKNNVFVTFILGVYVCSNFWKIFSYL